MKVVVDNNVAGMLANDPSKVEKLPLVNEESNNLIFRWPSLLEYLGIVEWIHNLPAFDQEQELFKGCIAALHEYEEKETLQYMFDRLFTEIVNQIIEIPELSPDSLSQAIKRRKASLKGVAERLIVPGLSYYENSLNQNTAYTMHDIILYLSWERMCVYVARLFDYQLPDPKVIAGINIIRDCLVESFLHIREQGRTIPSAFALFEALFFYYKREENLQKHTAEEWDLLSKSFKVLKNQEKPVDVFYVDDAIMLWDSLTGEKGVIFGYLTGDQPEKVNARVAFAQLIIGKLRNEFPEWIYGLQEQATIESVPS